MNILAIESSCDETAVAVVVNGRTVLADCISSQVDIHKIYGGVVPEIASRKHIEAIYPLADQALQTAELTRQDIDAVAVTYAPGLIGAVLVGVNFAKAAFEHDLRNSRITGGIRRLEIIRAVRSDIQFAVVFRPTGIVR